MHQRRRQRSTSSVAGEQRSRSAVSAVVKRTGGDSSAGFGEFELFMVWPSALPVVYSTIWRLLEPILGYLNLE